MELKGYTREFICTSQHEIERFIMHHMHMGDYNLADAEELSNGVKFECTVTPEVSDSDVAELVGMYGQASYESYSTRKILNYLCYKGHLPAGTYLIDVSW